MTIINIISLNSMLVFNYISSSIFFNIIRNVGLNYKYITSNNNRINFFKLLDSIFWAEGLIFNI